MADSNWIVGATIASAVGTVIYAGFAILQWLTLRRQADLLERSLDVTRDAISASNRNATAAFDSAHAARESVEIAAKQLRLAFTPVIDVAPRGQMISVSEAADGTQGRSYELLMWLVNTSDIAARVLRIDYEYKIEGEPDFGAASSAGFTCARDSRREFSVEVDLTKPTWDAMENRGIMIQVWVMLQIQHPTEGLFWHTFEMLLHQMGTRSVLMDWGRRDHRGYKDQPES
jgi:hypothetical protein